MLQRDRSLRADEALREPRLARDFPATVKTVEFANGKDKSWPTPTPEELSPFKIRVNAVRPGMTRSAGTAALFADGAPGSAQVDRLVYYYA